MQVSFSPYARLRMAARQISPDEVLTALAARPAGLPPAAADREARLPAARSAIHRFERGSLAVVYRREGDHITVLNAIRLPGPTASR